MPNGHGEPLTEAGTFEALPDNVKEDIRADLALLQMNLPVGEIMTDEPIGLGVTSGGLLVIKTAHAAYQLTDDGSTVKVNRGPDGLLIRTYRDGELIDNPPEFSGT